MPKYSNLIFHSHILNESTVQENHLSQKFMIVFAENTKNITEGLNDVFQLLWTNGLINSHVLVQDKDKIWTLYTFMPYQSDCFTLSPLKIATFTPLNYTKNIVLSFKELYPSKLKNFNNCPLFIAISNSKPYIIIQNYSARNVKIINEITKRLNMSIVQKNADSFGSKDNMDLVLKELIIKNDLPN